MKPLLFLLILMTFCAPFCWAIPPSDLFCFEVPLSVPTYYGTIDKSCDNGKTHVTQAHICSENVTCGYVNEAMKSAATDSSGHKKAFSELSAKEKSDYLKQNPDFEVFPTVLVCASNPDSTTCPAPNDCVGDVLFKARATDFSPDTHDAIIENQQMGRNNLLQQGQPSGAGTPK